MKRFKFDHLRKVHKKDWKEITILFIAAFSIYGWLSGNIIFASYSINYIPIAPANISIIIILSCIFLIYSQRNQSHLIDRIGKTIIVLIALYCLLIFIQYFFRLAWDVERIFLKEPQKLAGILMGRMSPITSLVYILICLGFLGTESALNPRLKYCGGTLSVLAFIVSSILLLGYLMNAPLLYGGSIIPVSLPSTICFVLFSLTLVQSYEIRYLSFNYLRVNKIARLLLKSFLPVVVFVITLEGILITRLNISGKNSTLAIAIILLVVVAVSILLIYRISSMTGDQLHKTEMALKESDAKYRLIADYNYDWEFWITNDKQFKYNSPSCERISGYNPSDFERNPDLITHIILPEDRHIYDNHIQLECQDDPCQGIDYRIITRNGQVKWVNHVCQPVYDASGYLIGRRGSNCDITDRKKAEDRINDLNRELKELNADKDRFLSILSHDLKSPFNTLIGFSEILIADIGKLDFKRAEDFARKINESAYNTYHLLNDILYWANSKQGKIQYRPQCLNLLDACSKVIDILNPNAQAKNISISYSGTFWKDVYADPDMLQTILRNLISNAIKFTHKDGRIIIGTSRIAENLSISISDNGIGIPPENISKLFDITEVLTTPGTENEIGTGLGLLLCRDFVEKNGGKIFIESEIDKGTTVSFTMPLFCS
jgi:two-component system, sensor histidine kinase and response regulator